MFKLVSLKDEFAVVSCFLNGPSGIDSGLQVLTEDYVFKIKYLILHATEDGLSAFFLNYL